MPTGCAASRSAASRRPRRRSTNFTYPGARQLYIYVKGEHLDAIPGLREFLAEYARGWAPGGYLAQRGLIPLPDADRSARAQAMVRRLRRPITAADLRLSVRASR